MKCSECPATGICSEYRDGYEDCCFGREIGPRINTCMMCTCRRLCEQCAGAGKALVITEERMTKQDGLLSTMKGLDVVRDKDTIEEIWMASVTKVLLIIEET